jgi:TRAP-type C4-dicarboxylate transport system permease small subunit
MITKAFDGLAAAVKAAVTLVLAAMLSLLAFQVFMRSVLDMPPSWTEEIALAGFTWAVMLGIPLCLRERGHVRMDIVVDQLPAPVQWALEKLSSLLILGTGAFLAYSGWFYMLNASGTTSAAIGYPMPWLYASAPVSGALITLFAAEAIFLAPAEVRGGDREAVPEPAAADAAPAAPRALGAPTP